MAEMTRDEALQKAPEIIRKMKSQIGDDVIEVYSHEALFKTAARVIEALSRPEPVPEDVEALISSLDDLHYCEVRAKAADLIRTLSAERDALAKRVQELEVGLAYIRPGDSLKGPEAVDAGWLRSFIDRALLNKEPTDDQ